jgi:hypothetical protein
MPTPRGPVVPLIVLGGLTAAAVGIAALVDRFGSRPSTPPAPDGTPQVGSRLPIALWPSNGAEPMVDRGPRGWREMVAALYHRDTSVDDAARARAIVVAEYPRREQDTRRAIALEAHVLRNNYEPALVAAAWLHPLRKVSLDDLATFGIGESALATLRAAAQMDAHPEIIAVWRRELGVDVVNPQVTEAIIAETPPQRYGMLWAVLLDLAADRVLARQVSS